MMHESVEVNQIRRTRVQANFKHKCANSEQQFGKMFIVEWETFGK